MALRHYLAQFPRRFPNRQTYVLHVKCRKYVREVGMRHHAAFFTTMPAHASRRSNPLVSARGYANTVYSMKIPASLPHSRQQHLLCTNISRTSRMFGLTPPGVWTMLTTSKNESVRIAVSIAFQSVIVFRQSITK